MSAVVLQGKGLVRGRGRGPALVTRQPINFTAALTKVPNMLPSRRAEICDRHHELHGRNVAGQVLVFPSCIGSTHTGLVLLELVARGAGPAGMLVQAGDSLLVSGVVLSDVWFDRVIPIVEYAGPDLFDRIADGMTVELDGTTGTITVDDARSG
jgi:hypothetical protein